MAIQSLIIALVAGETSGDILGAGLIRAIKKKHPNAYFVGIAGPLMQLEGCVAWYDLSELSVMGFSEVLFCIRRLWYIRRVLTRRLINLKPDVFIGIDSPDFNLTLEKNLRRQGIRTIHYVSPALWAWRKNRIYKIRHAVDLILLLFPFEKLFYDHFDIPCCFIGHALADLMPIVPNKSFARYELGISDKALCLALLPGSRSAEINMLGADFLKTAMILREKYPELEILVPLVNDKHQAQFKAIQSRVSPNLSVRYLDGKSRQAMQASDATLLASGTATLECMLARCPMVVTYRVKPVTFWLARRLVRTEYISLPNILAGFKLVPELLQDNCQPSRLAAELELFLDQEQSCYALFDIFSNLHKQLRQNANEKAAEAVLGICK
ncbi:lipid-A-disaccharide synthase [Candidatus Erwinia haradaeae]|uniref:Lipid-A-disaccharide synthase n=1 Tax=Candidatus Erwinia haradaeae TaxID=1922217 RepID=A0A451DL32_9GAMM|nr:lipid-A-disaccharide synthase [Candidatus Erwinia haradaeae]VFP87449.1 Lipid-A-disaccharide synthase [Candidatus Erwinia haradaeae]